MKIGMSGNYSNVELLLTLASTLVVPYTWLAADRASKLQQTECLCVDALWRWSYKRHVKCHNQNNRDRHTNTAKTANTKVYRDLVDDS